MSVDNGNSEWHPVAAAQIVLYTFEETQGWSLCTEAALDADGDSEAPTPYARLDLFEKVFRQTWIQQGLQDSPGLPETLRFVARTNTGSREVILNSYLAADKPYKKHSESFHHWADDDHLYGFQFQSESLADEFMEKVRTKQSALLSSRSLGNNLGAASEPSPTRRRTNTIIGSVRQRQESRTEGLDGGDTIRRVNSVPERHDAEECGEASPLDGAVWRKLNVAGEELPRDDEKKADQRQEQNSSSELSAPLSPRVRTATVLVSPRNKRHLQGVKDKLPDVTTHTLRYSAGNSSPNNSPPPSSPTDSSPVVSPSLAASASPRCNTGTSMQSHVPVSPRSNTSPANLASTMAFARTSSSSTVSRSKLSPPTSPPTSPPLSPHRPSSRAPRPIHTSRGSSIGSPPVSPPVSPALSTSPVVAPAMSPSLRTTRPSKFLEFDTVGTKMSMSERQFRPITRRGSRRGSDTPETMICGVDLVIKATELLIAQFDSVFSPEDVAAINSTPDLSHLGMVPVVMRWCINFLREQGLSMPYILAVNLDYDTIARSERLERCMLEAATTPPDVMFGGSPAYRGVPENCDPDLVAEVLKRQMRSKCAGKSGVKSWLLSNDNFEPEKSFQELVEAVSCNGEVGTLDDDSTLLRFLREMIEVQSTANRQVAIGLCHLFHHIHKHHEENKMDSGVIASVFGEFFFKRPDLSYKKPQKVQLRSKLVL